MISLKLDTALWNFVPGYTCDMERNINPVFFNKGGGFWSPLYVFFHKKRR